jgi:hypothetical protein
MSKNKKRIKNKQNGVLDVTRIERLVYRLLHEDYQMSWYNPDNIHELPWDEIVEAFDAGYILALDAVFRAFNGDGGQRLQEILNQEIIIVRAADRAEYEEKKREGLIPLHFRSQQEADEFLQHVGDLEGYTIPLECPN